MAKRFSKKAYQALALYEKKKGVKLKGEARKRFLASIEIKQEMHKLLKKDRKHG